MKVDGKVVRRIKASEVGERIRLTGLALTVFPLRRSPLRPRAGVRRRRQGSTSPATPRGRIRRSTPALQGARRSAPTRPPSPSAAPLATPASSNAFGAPTSGLHEPERFSALSDGSHTFSFRASAASGNADASPATRTLIVDTPAPDTTIDSGPEGGSMISTNSATFTFHGTAGDTSKLECKLDAASFTTCSSANMLSALAEGQHTVYLRAPMQSAAWTRGRRRARSQSTRRRRRRRSTPARQRDRDQHQLGDLDLHAPRPATPASSSASSTPAASRPARARRPSRI